jgi:hypothetical protein
MKRALACLLAAATIAASVATATDASASGGGRVAVGTED